MLSMFFVVTQLRCAAWQHAFLAWVHSLILALKVGLDNASTYGDDFTHGTWHFLAALVVMGLGLGLVEGLSGEIAPPSGYLERTCVAWRALSGAEMRSTC